MKIRPLIATALISFSSIGLCLAADDDGSADEMSTVPAVHKDVAPHRSAIAIPVLPPVRQVLSIGSLTATQKRQIDAIYKNLNGSAHANAEQIHARIMASAQRKASADALSTQAQKDNQNPSVAIQTRKKYATEYGAAIGYHQQARQMQLELSRQRQAAWSRVRAILTADQLKAFDQSTRNMYVPPVPEPPAP